MILVIAKASIKSGYQDDFKSVAKDLVKNTKTEEGCLEYQIYQSKDNSSLITFVEKWQDSFSLKKHEETDFFCEVITRLKSYSHSIEIDLYEEII